MAKSGEDNFPFEDPVRLKAWLDRGCPKMACGCGYSTNAVVRRMYMGIFNYHGEIIPSDDFMISVTENMIPFRTSNPPIRTMFACSMIKQAIFGDYRN